MISLELLLAIFIARGIIIFTVAGILISELFDIKRKMKSDIFWLLSTTISWIIFAGLIDYEIFTGKIPFFPDWIAIILLVFAISTFTYILIIKNFKFINNFLTFPSIIFALILLITILFYNHIYHSFIIPYMMTISFTLTLFGAFTFIDFLIKTSERKI